MEPKKKCHPQILDSLETSCPQRDLGVPSELVQHFHSLNCFSVSLHIINSEFINSISFIQRFIPLLNSLSLSPPVQQVSPCCLLQIPFHLLNVSLDTALAPGLLMPPPLRRFWNRAAAIAWLGFALAAFCAFYAVFASPSQDTLSGIWGGCSFTFHRFTFCSVSLLEGLPRKYIFFWDVFLMEPSATQLAINLLCSLLNKLWPPTWLAALNLPALA